MSRQLLKSRLTDVVLPYCKAALKSPNVRECTTQEVIDYEVLMGVRSADTIAVSKPVAKTAPLRKKSKPAEQPAVVVTDFVEGEPSVEAVLGALEAG